MKKIVKHKFTYWEDGEIVTIHPPEKLRVECCDCSLVHVFDFAISTENNEIHIDCERDDAATKELRKKHGIKIIHQIRRTK